MQFPAGPRPAPPSYLSTGRNPYGNFRNTPPPPPAVNVAALAFGANPILDDPRYLATNLPPYTSH